MSKVWNFNDLTGKKFNRLTVIRFYSTRKEKSHWLCLCDCGKEHIVVATALKSGNTKSCGCLAKKGMSPNKGTHRKSSDRIYGIYNNMVERCTNPKNKDYDRYGGRGINVCGNWNTFESFYKDMGDPPTKLHTLDRDNNDKGYCKENCSWKTRKEQANNRNNSIFFSVDGLKLNRTDFAKHIGITRKTLYKYLDMQYTTEQIINTFSKGRNGSGKPLIN